MSDNELSLALAEELSAIMTASEENLVVTPEISEVPETTAVPKNAEAPEAAEVPEAAALVTIEPPESVTAIKAQVEESEMVLQEVESVVAQPDADDSVIVDAPAPQEGFVKRWTRKIVGWVKRVFKWAQE